MWKKISERKKIRRKKIMKLEVDVNEIIYPARCVNPGCETSKTNDFEVIIDKAMVKKGYISFRCKLCKTIAKVPQ